MTRSWSDFFRVWAIWIGCYMMSISVSMLAVQFFIRRGFELDNISLALIFGLPLAFLQYFFLGGRSLWLILPTIGGCFIGFLIATASGYQLPRQLPDPIVGAMIGLALGIAEQFFKLKGERPANFLVNLVWSFGHIIGWSLGFLLFNKLALALYDTAITAGASIESAIYPSTALAAFVAGGVIGAFSGLAFAWVHMRNV